jgi:hypothetical protein
VESCELGGSGGGGHVEVRAKDEECQRCSTHTAVLHLLPAPCKLTHLPERLKPRPEVQHSRQRVLVTEKWKRRNSTCCALAYLV